MPHVVIEEAGDLQGLYQAFTPIIHRAGSEILKVQEFFSHGAAKTRCWIRLRSKTGLRAPSLSSSSFTRRRSPSVSCLPQILRRPLR
jgi:hypothetical protein